LKEAWGNQGRYRSHCGDFLRIIVELRRSCAAISHPPAIQSPPPRTARATHGAAGF
jgi:hypothetical protein